MGSIYPYECKLRRIATAIGLQFSCTLILCHRYAVVRPSIYTAIFIQWGLTKVRHCEYSLNDWARKIFLRIILMKSSHAIRI